MWGEAPFLPFQHSLPQKNKKPLMLYTLYTYICTIYISVCVFVCMDVCMCTNMRSHIVKTRLRTYFNQDYFSSKHEVTWNMLYFSLWTLDFCSEESWIHPLGVVHSNRTYITSLLHLLLCGLMEYFSSILIFYIEDTVVLFLVWYNFCKFLKVCKISI